MSVSILLKILLFIYLIIFSNFVAGYDVVDSGCNIGSCKIPQLILNEISIENCDLDDLISQHMDTNNKVVPLNITIQNSSVNCKINAKNTIFRENVCFNNVIFVEDVDFSNCLFLKELLFNNCTFNRSVYFSDAEFKYKTKFEDTIFRREVYFERINSTDKITFVCSKFLNSYFSKAIFDCNVNFADSIFAGDVDFTSAEFKKDCYFNFARFDKRSMFLKMKANNIKFSNVTFNSTNFKNAVISGDADFSGAEFHRTTIFDGVEFKGPVNFENAKFYEKVFLEDSIFYDTLNLQKVLFQKNISLNRSRIKEEANLQGAVFKDNFFIQNVRASSLLISWSVIKKAINDDGAGYIFLIKNFRELEQFEDADDCYFQFRMESLLHKKWTELSKYLDIISLISCGFGVRLICTIISSLLCIILFAIKYYDGDFKYAMYFSASLFLQLPARGEQYETMEAIHNYAIIIERLLGWSLMAVFIVVLNYRLGIGLI